MGTITLEGDKDQLTPLGTDRYFILTKDCSLDSGMVSSTTAVIRATPKNGSKGFWQDVRDDGNQAGVVTQPVV